MAPAGERGERRAHAGPDGARGAQRSLGQEVCEEGGQGLALGVSLAVQEKLFEGLAEHWAIGRGDLGGIEAEAHPLGAGREVPDEEIAS